MTALARTGSGDFPLHLKALISGPPKSGKTTLLGTVPNIVIADTEPHANNLMSLAHLNVPYKTINSTTDLKDLHMILANESLRKQAAEALGIPDIEAVAIDTLDTLQGLMKRERLAENRATQFLRDDWGWLKTEMENILQSFLALPMHVFLVVHTKTKDVGTEKNPRSVILPGLEGAISESVAGMVGYSLLSFRKQEFRADGTPYTKYWLRAEGDETYEFLGNRAAGRLPDVIEPDFNALLAAAKAGLAQAQAHQTQTVQVQVDPQSAIQTTGQTAPAAQPAQQVAQSVPQVTPAATEDKPADDQPITAAALQHVAKLYATVGLQFPDDLFKDKTVGFARDLVKVYQAILKDHSEGKGSMGGPDEQMRDHLQNMGLVLPDAPPAAPEGKPEVQPKIDGTIEEVMAYAGTDLARIQEAYDFETGPSGKSRKSLIEKLTAAGAKVQTHAETSEAAVPEATPPVNPEAATADDKSAEVQVIEAALGPIEVVSTEINPEALCEVCDNKIDDVDLALLGKNRFDKIMCVADYLQEIKK